MSGSVKRVIVPRYKGFKPSSEQAAKTLSSVKSRGTKPEMIFRKALWKGGVRFYLTKYNLPGKPDLVLSKKRIVIFIDGDFWHGFNWDLRKPKMKANREYWIPKIERNMQRDKEVNTLLESQGWRVLRIWEHEVMSNIADCVSRVIRFISGPSHLPTE
jgi:DNA mismatch endonuclease, patch repair protein